MRVLLVSHLFPPRHSAGTEVYTAELGVQLAARGHAVTVFTTDKDVARENLSVRRYEHRGLPVVEVTNNLFHKDFEATWSHSGIARRFSEAVTELRPDVIHFQHLMYLGIDCLGVAREAARAVLFTLHDFWLECPRMGQLVHADGGVCHEVDHARCGTCLPTFAWRQSDLARRTGRVLARVKRATGLDLASFARSLARGGAQATPTGWTAPDEEEARRFTARVRTRDAELRESIPAHVDRFLAPSRFLRDRLVRWGLPAERVHYVPTGIDRAAFAPRPRTASERVRVTFLGTLVPLKGAHVLVEAWAKLTPDERARGELIVHGPGEHAPDYVDGLRARAGEVGARMPGALGRDDVPEALARTDVVVVPSLWFENRPLVQLEALCAGVPLIVSDLGGMAELVSEGRDGWRFPAGDVDALAERLRAVLSDPSLLTELAPAADELPSWEEFTADVLAHYDALLEEHG